MGIVLSVESMISSTSTLSPVSLNRESRIYSDVYANSAIIVALAINASRISSIINSQSSTLGTNTLNTSKVSSTISSNSSILDLAVALRQEISSLSLSNSSILDTLAIVNRNISTDINSTSSTNASAGFDLGLISTILSESSTNASITRGLSAFSEIYSYSDGDGIAGIIKNIDAIINVLSSIPEARILMWDNSVETYFTEIEDIFNLLVSENAEIFTVDIEDKFIV